MHLPLLPSHEACRLSLTLPLVHFGWPAALLALQRRCPMPLNFCYFHIDPATAEARNSAAGPAPSLHCPSHPPTIIDAMTLHLFLSHFLFLPSLSSYSSLPPSLSPSLPSRLPALTPGYFHSSTPSSLLPTVRLCFRVTACTPLIVSIASASLPGPEDPTRKNQSGAGLYALVRVDKRCLGGMDWIMRLAI